jgi:3-oxoacyl-[acyl-carrier protein] reductase
MKLKGRVALVTGAGRGIGKEIALTLAREGASVVVLGRSETVNETVNEIRKMKGKAMAVIADVSNFKQMQDVANIVIKKFGRIDILVNNAGIFRSSPIAQMKEEDWDEMMAVDLKGVFNCTRAVLPGMIKQKYGKIVNISSIAGTALGFSGSTHYSAAKAGIIGFSEALAMEVAQYGINVNSVAPGTIETDMLKEAMGEAAKDFAKQVPIGRLGKPKDVAETVLFLVSDEASYITGQLIVVDGGLVIKP